MLSGTGGEILAQGAVIVMSRWNYNIIVLSIYACAYPVALLRSPVSIMTKGFPRSCHYLGRSSVWIRSNCYASTKEPRHASGTTCSTPAAAESSSGPRPTVDRMIRVNHAGEFGANRIYAGQISVLGDSSVGSSIKVSE